MKNIFNPSRQIKVSELVSDDFFDEISHDWQHKAKQPQVRRWRSLKRAMKGDRYATR